VEANDNQPAGYIRLIILISTLQGVSSPCHLDGECERASTSSVRVGMPAEGGQLN